MTVIKIKRSFEPGKVPLLSDLAFGELALNVPDRILYIRTTFNSVDTIVPLAGNGIGGANVTISEIPPATGEIGDLWWNPLTSILSIYYDDGSGPAWFETNYVEGPTGFTGSIGYVGSIGFTGSVGFTGSIGFVGSIGRDGSIGFVGSRGLRGFDGSQGEQGFIGSVGYVGSQGEQGFIGSVGYVGSQGVEGFVGSTGEIGLTGSRGFVGSIGLEGSTGFTGSAGFNGSIGLTGSQGFTGSTGFTGSVGLAGSQGFVGSTGFIGSTGLAGSTGFMGSQGFVGSTGFAGSGGFIGSRGLDGSTGFTGSQGFVGSTGFTGSTGFIGSQGIEGFVGSIGLVGSQGFIGSASTLPGLTGSVGLTGSTGLTGSRGSTGATGFTGSQGLRGPVGFVGSKGEIGSIGFTGSVGIGFVGSASSTPGLMGSAGFTGSTGLTGSRGSQGFFGSGGFTGSQGYAGSTGFSGSEGFVGSRGFAGSEGFVGSTGFEGSVGLTGSQGFTGSVGFMGSQGFVGSTGFIGLTGSIGFVGSTGLTGSTGFTGSVGFVGSTGLAGSIGLTGSVGFVGSTGFTGSQGFNGSVGLTGSIGFIGSTGFAGSRGFSGSQGFTGSVGLTGSQGFVGSVGFIGSQGFTGSTGFTGSRGLDGSVGLTGSQGFVGSRGLDGGSGGIGFTGSVGFTGSTGFTGSQGFVGSTGFMGSVGLTGSQGFIGSTGFIGSRGFGGSEGFIGSVGLTGSTGFTGSQGFIGSVGLTGSQGFLGSRGFTGSVGLTGSIGFVGSTGFTGSVGLAGSQGFVGSTGFIGSRGFTGSRGLDGTSGGVGFTGSTGFIGSQGFTGSRGLDGTSGGIGFTGSGGFNGSQGFTGSTGFIGSQGFTGSGGFTGSTGSRGFTGSGGFTGSVGFSGSQGFTGSRGFMGSIGFIGSVGFAGSSGFIGSTGSVGFTGSRGLDGTSGGIGFTGSSGFNGSTGFTGSFGFVGSRGFNGSQGFNGSSGFVGSSGFIGSVGFAGSSGFTGSRGLDGTSGGTGFTGSFGFSGSQGFIGSIGFIGSRGFDGSVGFNGSQGFTGSTGFTGSIGFVGSTGFTGSRGLDGTSGGIGFTGSIGFVGSQGFIGSTGFTGSRGFTGSTGFTGSIGFVGSTGLTGSTGFTGSIGFVGSVGLTGSQGIAGAAGPSNVLNATADTSATTHFPVFVAGTGNQTPRIRNAATALSYIPSTGTLSTRNLALNGRRILPTLIGQTGAEAHVGPINPIWGILKPKGNKLRVDEEFRFGFNLVGVYNNFGGTAVTITRKNSNFLDGHTFVPNTSGFALEIRHAPLESNGITPGYGGWFFAIQSVGPGRTYICTFRMKIPIGRTINFGSNLIGLGGFSEWLTDNIGTGQYEDYAYILTTGGTGTFSTTFFFFVDGGDTNPFFTYLASATVYDTTNTDTDSFRSINVDSTVGIGTNSPIDRLHVEGGRTRISTNMPDDNPLLVFNSPSTGYGPYFQGGSGVRYSLHVTDNVGNSRFIVQGGGRVGIGITNPSSQLDVISSDLTVGTFRSTLSDVYIRLINSVNTEGYIGLQSGDMTFWNVSERMRINSSGNVGIGTTNPLTSLDLGNSFFDGTPTTLTQLINKISLWQGGGVPNFGFGISSGSLNIVAGQAGSIIRFYAGGTNERMRITSDGHIDILDGHIDLSSSRSIGYLARSDRGTFNGASYAQYGSTYGSVVSGDTNASTFVSGFGGVRIMAGGSPRISVSQGGNVGFSGGTFIASNGDVYSQRANGPTGVYYFAGGNAWLFWDGGRYLFSAAGPVDSDISFRAPIFFDTNDTNFFINPNATSIIHSLNMNGTLQMNSGLIIGRPTIGADVNTNNDTGSLSIRGDGSNAASISFHRVGNFAINMGLGTDNVFRIGGWSANANAFTMDSAGRLTLLTDVRAPIFFDSNNTGYFIDPTGTTSLRTVGDWRADGSAWTGEFAGKIQYHGSNWYLQFGNALIGRNGVGTDVFIVNNAGNVSASADFRAPIFFDTNDTSFFIDPNGNNRLRNLCLGGGTAYDASLHIVGIQGGNGRLTQMSPSGASQSGLNILSSRNASNADQWWAWGVTTDNFWRIGPGTTFTGSGFAVSTAGDCFAQSSFRAPVFFDSANSSYFIDPDGTSTIRGTLTVTNSTNAGAFGGFEAREINYAGAGTGALSEAPRYNLHWSGRDAMGLFFHNGALVFAGFQDINTNRRSIIVNEVFATGNITAFWSDDRLKTKLGNIENALDIVCSLNGFKYVNNDTARQFGFDNEKIQLGLSAQEVEKVLPELVELAVFDRDINSETPVSRTGEDYKTIQYDRIIPVLVEAIKQLNEEINILKDQRRS